MSKIQRFTKRELYDDNVRMKKYIDNLEARNYEMAIVIEDNNKLINLANKIIRDSNNEIISSK